MESFRQKSEAAKLLFLLLKFITNGSGETVPECKQNFKGCCVGYFWNQMINRCEQCMPGYSGLNCTTRCPYPFYGYRCQGNCDCSNDTCDVSTGCRTITTGQFNYQNVYIYLYFCYEIE
ncbi:scavenger receptor class F member 1-like [Crassostrea angulata]|uniref:scavenger receptor class F member 1-like n=1 Tax=Magallana angulata TaxID=2784310 RepID=UPI0022B1D3C2|nr:scavenger receptor class F member 1-like [Crassostrea angulata]